MDFAVETWDPGYGTSTQQGDQADSARPVEAGIEVPVDRWQPITVSDQASAPSSVAFVDGVQRIDARVWINQVDQVATPGVCATVAAGTVVCTSNTAQIEAILVRRGLYTSAVTARSVINPGGLGQQVAYEVREVAGDSEEAISMAVHNHMTEVEHELSDQLKHHDMVIFDGPLGRRDDPNGVGYVKTQHVHYLADDLRSVLASLKPGQRTPVFRIGGHGPNWSWYMRLPGPVSHTMSGIVRLELPALGDITDAVDRADEITVTLPRFASEAHKDSRAPQNLYPIAGLERQLRRHLGDSKLLERALRTHANQPVAEPDRPRPIGAVGV